MIVLGAVSIDLDARTVEHSGGRHTLTPREAQALAYLLGRRGKTISRRELEREIWGLRAGVKPQTVPVTLRRLRAKLEPDPSAPTHLITVPKVGWRIPAPPDTWNTLPRFGSPNLPRPIARAALNQLFETGWRCVCVVGQAGLGKTRLVVEAARDWPQGAVFVPLQSVATLLALQAAFADVLELSTGDCASVVRGLSMMGHPLLILDAAEASVPLLAPYLDALMAQETQRVLIATQRAPQRSDTASYALPAMDLQTGVRFLTQCLLASRWGGEALQLEAVVQELDGLPLALELVAAQAGGLLDPAGAPLGGLDQALNRAWMQLSGGAQVLLGALSLFRGTFSSEDVLSTGANAQDFEGLCERSWLSLQSGRWRLLHTTQRFVAQATPPTPAAQETHLRWLIRRCLHWEQALNHAPQQTLKAWAPLLPELTAALEHGPAEQVGALLRPIRELMKHLGRHTELAELALRAEERGCTDPGVYAVLLSEVRPTGYAGLWPRIALGSTLDRAVALSALIASRDPLPEGALSQCTAELDPKDPAAIRLAWYTLWDEMERSPGPPSSVLLERIGAVLARSQGHAVLAAGALQLRALAQVRAGHVQEALVSAERSVARAQQAHHAELERTCTTHHILTLSISRPKEALARALWAHRSTLRHATPVIISKAACRVGVCAWIAQDQEQARVWLARELEPGSALPPRHRPLVQAFFTAAIAEPGPASGSTVTSLAGLLRLEPLVQAVLAGEADAADQLSALVPKETLLGVDSLTLGAQARLQRILSRPKQTNKRRTNSGNSVG